MDSENLNSKYRPGELIDNRYSVISLLGQGGMAEVYLCEDSQMHRKKVALKLLFSNIAVDKTYSERFLREAELMQKHSNPHIIRSYHYGKTERNEHYFTMEYAQGRTLSQVLAEEGKIPYPRALNYIVQICAGLDAAHKLGIIHRDIKPDNIILTSDGTVKITDFGIAKDLNTSIKLTELEKGPKSYAYKAPELYVKDYDQRVDIYSLGITAFELICGDLPFKGERHHLIVAHLTSALPELKKLAPESPAWVQDFLDICCAKDPEKRFKNAADAILFLKKYQSEIESCNHEIFKLYNESISVNSFRKRYVMPQRLGNFLTIILGKYLASFIISFIVAVLFYPWNSSRHELIGDSLDLFLNDRYFEFRGKIQPPQDIIIVSIDEESYSKLNLSTLKPWPRDKMAEGLEILAKNNVSKVILDFIYIDLNDNQKLSGVDQRLSDAIGLNPTYLAKAYKTKNFSQSPHDIFLKNAKGAFDANILNPGVVRNFNLTPVKIEGLMTLSAVLNAGTRLKTTDPSAFDMINFYGPPRTIKNLSFYKLIGGEFEKDLFKDKIVLIGQHLTVGYQVRQADTFPTPYKGYMAGVEIHATCLGNLIQKNWISRLNPMLETIIIFYLSFLFAYLVISMTPLHGFIFINFSLFIWIMTSYTLFTQQIFIPLILIFIVTNPLSFGVSALTSYLNKKKLEQALGI